MISNDLSRFIGRTRIAYFSMEIALRPEIHTYAGGLGGLAGDTARSAADLDLPMVFVTLISRSGYLRQEIGPDGWQIDHPDPWRPDDWTIPLGAKVVVHIEDREVWLRPWLYSLTSALGYTVPVILLDTDVNENQPEDRALTDRLYGGSSADRLKQEVVLGIGGVRVLRALGFDIRTYHLNEGHAALLTAELLGRFRLFPAHVRHGDSPYDAAQVREMCIFTTHTPVEAGHDRFDYELARRVLGRSVDLEELKRFAGTDMLNMTRLALSLSSYVNGVAQRHARTTTGLFPGYRIHAVTNGVHAPTWTAPSFARLYQRHFPNWAHEPEILAHAEILPDEAVWEAHQEAKRALLTKIADLTGVAMRADLPLVVFARRMTGYKRPEMLFADLDRLVAIHRNQPFQVVLGGKAHPNDDVGKALIQAVHGHIRALAGKIPIAYLPNYDMSLAASMAGGADIWLNTPTPPLEASGTSGMKAALNGGLNLSVLDGWWVEACIEGVTGWAIGTDHPEDGMAHAAALYDKLEHVVLPQYYHDRARWIWMMKQAIGKIGSYFNTQRMMRRYATEAYLR